MGFRWLELTRDFVSLTFLFVSSVISRITFIVVVIITGTLIISISAFNSFLSFRTLIVGGGLAISVALRIWIISSLSFSISSLL